MNSKATYNSKEDLHRSIQAARGEVKADLVLKNAHLLDVFNGRFVQGDVAVYRGKIVGIIDQYEGIEVRDMEGRFIVPGFIDSHVHIESSLMTPARFQQAVLPCGTTSVIWDPHEIANVKGVEGIQWALEASEGLDLDVFVMVPSCVPSTTPSLNLETSGADLRAGDIEKFRNHKRVLGLAEMMNFPGLLMGDDDVLQKISDFSEMKRDGHCPGLSGKDLNAYGVAGIHSCHESTSIEEAREKLSKGIHVLLREGSCAKNAETLLPLLNSYTSSVLSLCSDDRNPADINEQGHIDFILNLALSMGFKPEDAFRSASYAAAKTYGLEDRGAIAPGYNADFCIIKQNKAGEWSSGFVITDVYKSGVLVTKDRLESMAQSQRKNISGKNMNIDPVTGDMLQIKSTSGEEKVRVIQVIPNQIVTNPMEVTLKVENGNIQASKDQDVIKIGVFERHKKTGRHGVGFVHGFGLKQGAIATSINHDSHNIIAVGADDRAMLDAIEHLVKIDGGIVVTDGNGNFTDLPLEVGGLMSDKHPDEVAKALDYLKNMANSIGCELHEPFLQLSFLALPVIPTLKITDRGLVDVTQFKLVDVVVS